MLYGEPPEVGRQPRLAKGQRAVRPAHPVIHPEIERETEREGGVRLGLVPVNEDAPAPHNFPRVVACLVITELALRTINFSR